MQGDARSDAHGWVGEPEGPRLLPQLQADNAHADAWLAPHRPLQPLCAFLLAQWGISQ